MSKYLIKTQEQWRVDSESEAKALIEEAKNEKTSILAKYSSEYKEQKDMEAALHYFFVKLFSHGIVLLLIEYSRKRKSQTLLFQ